MKRPVIFDVDGVLADFIKGFTTLANKRDSTVPIVRQEDQQTWLESTDFSKDIWFRVWDEIKRCDKYWFELKPIVDPYVFDRINKLSDSRELYFVTSRIGNNPKLQTEIWLEKFGITNPTVVICSRKGEMARAVDAEWLLEDKAGNAVYTAYHSPTTKACLIDRPYNQFTHRSLGSKVKRFWHINYFLNEVESS